MCESEIRVAQSGRKIVGAVDTTLECLPSVGIQIALILCRIVRPDCLPESYSHKRRENHTHNLIISYLSSLCDLFQDMRHKSTIRVKKGN